MKPVQRLISGMLSLILVCSLCLAALPTARAASQPSGLTVKIAMNISF